MYLEWVIVFSVGYLVIDQDDHQSHNYLFRQALNHLTCTVIDSRVLINIFNVVYIVVFGMLVTDSGS